jgi:hypothetical protein
MAIGSVVQRGSTIYIYDEKGRSLTAVSAGGKPPDGLVGYTSTTVSVRRGSTIYMYNEKGMSVGTVFAR